MSPTVWIVVAAAAGVVILYAIVTYNTLVGKMTETKNAWSQIDVQLKRRYDLIPNLVETVKGYAAHEKETFERVIQARNAAISAKGVESQAAAESQLSGALRGFFALSEAYPELKANENFKSLQEELSATENRIGFARQHYNDAVGSYNANLLMFPANVVAGVTGFRQAEFFQLDPAEAAAARQAPQVKF